MRTALRLFDIKLLPASLDGFRKMVNDSLGREETVTIGKINAEILVRAIRNKEFADTLNSFTYNIVDGRGVVWAAHYLSLPVSRSSVTRLLQAIWQMVATLVMIVFAPRSIEEPLPDHIPGVNAFEAMITAATDNRSGVFFFGASEKVVNHAITNLEKKYSNLKVSGYLNGYDCFKKTEIDPAAAINQTNATMLFVALGSPKQEYWIRDNVRKLEKVRIVVAEGGTLDRIAYPAQKAPSIINSIGLEWLWRLFMNKNLTDNRNRFSRFWNSVPALMFEAFKYKLASRGEPTDV